MRVIVFPIWRFFEKYCGKHRRGGEGDVVGLTVGGEGRGKFPGGEIWDKDLIFSRGSKRLGLRVCGKNSGGKRGVGFSNDTG